MTSKENRAFADYLNDSGVPHVVTFTDNGTHSAKGFHKAAATDGRGTASDVALRWGAGSNPEGLQPIFDALALVGDQLAELYYSRASFFIRNGKRIPIARLEKSIRDGHYDHVHVAVRKGVFIKWPKAKAAQPAPPTTTEDEYMPENTDVMDSCTDPKTGGLWRVSWDGGISNTNGAPLFGSYGMIDEKDRNVPRHFNTIAAFRDGYVIISTTGEEYFFNPVTAAELRAKGRF